MLSLPEVVSRSQEQLDDLRSFADRLRLAIVQTPRNQLVPGLDRIQGRDGTNTVTCVVDTRGRFLDLSISSDWWHTAGPGGIARAVLDALSLAQDKSLCALNLIYESGREAELPPLPQNPVFHKESTPTPFYPVSDFAEAKAKIERTYAIMSIADGIARTRDSEAERTLRGPRGLFRLRLVGFTVTRAEVNQHGLSTSDRQRITEDAREALLQATREKDPTYLFREVAC